MDKIIVTLYHPPKERCSDFTRFKQLMLDEEKKWERHFGDIDFFTVQRDDIPDSRIVVEYKDKKERFGGLRLDKLTDKLKKLRNIK